MEGILAAVPQKMRVGKVALPEAAYIFQPQKTGVCCGRSAQGRVPFQAQGVQVRGIVFSAAFPRRLPVSGNGRCF